MSQIKFKPAAALFLTAVMGVFSGTSNACTAFALQEGPSRVIAKSFDWGIGTGSVLTNKRNVSKTAFTLLPFSSPAKWVSKYGSLTFNQHGREFPLGGMNEQGLVVEILWLDETDYGDSDADTVNELQWIQYQLDTRATVKEVVKGIGDVRISRVYASVHYLVCDRAECATVEFIDGKPVIHAGDKLPAAVLANDTYESSARALKNFEPFGGKKPLPSDSSSVSRFTRAAGLVLRAAKELNEKAADAAFRILKSVEQKNFSQWNIVYDPVNLTVRFKTLAQASVKSLSFGSFDFSCGSPVKGLDINTATGGEAASKFAPFTGGENKKLAKGGFAVLSSFGSLADTAIGMIADYPAESTRCAAPKN